MPAPFHTGLHDVPRGPAARRLVVAALCAVICVPALPFAAHAGEATHPGATRTATRLDPHERAWVLRKVASLVANDPEPRTVSNPCK